MSDQPMSRREARELERIRATAELPVSGPAADASGVVTQMNSTVESLAQSAAALADKAPDVPVLSRKEARQMERSTTSDSPKFLEFAPGTEVEDVQLASTGPIKVLEPTSLVVDNYRDITNMTVSVPDSNMVIQTGSIELPWLTKAETGQVAVVEAANEADSAVSSETELTVTGISPVPARVHERTRRKASVFPTKLRRGWGVVYLVGVCAFLLGIALCMFIAAVLVGIIKL
jgi:hypothetical protein